MYLIIKVGKKSSRSQLLLVLQKHIDFSTLHHELPLVVVANILISTLPKTKPFVIFCIFYWNEKLFNVPSLIMITLTIMNH